MENSQIPNSAPVTPQIPAEPTFTANVQSPQNPLPTEPPKKKSIWKIILISLGVIVFLFLVWFGFLVVRLNTVRKLESGDFPKILPKGYSQNDVLVVKISDDKTNMVSAMYYGNGTTIYFDQGQMVLACDKAKAGGTLISDYSDFTPQGFDGGCTFMVGSLTTGKRYYIWTNQSTKYTLSSKSPFLSIADATNIAESLQYGQLSSSLSRLVKTYFSPPSY